MARPWAGTCIPYSSHPPHGSRTLAFVLVGAPLLLPRACFGWVFGWRLAPGAAPAGILAIIVVLVCRKYFCQR
jgi:hypothetical protein